MQLPDKKDFEKELDGKAVSLFILKNGKITAAFTNYGARIVSLLVPDEHGELVDVIVGPGTLHDFLTCKEPYYGAAIGRYANRIAKGKFSLEGKQYNLAVNNGENHLHGGPKGFHNVVWNVKHVSDNELYLHYHSADGEEGFPGNLDVKLVYALTEDNAFSFHFEAVADKTTVCNFTNHAFFNLNGCSSGMINNHLLQINAEKYLPIDSTLIPTGETDAVAGTAFDFLKLKEIGLGLMQNPLQDDSGFGDEQLKFGAGYDHCFVLNKIQANAMSLAAVAIGDKSNIEMKVYTKEPGLQFYGGNFMNGTNKIKEGGRDECRTAFALETQHFPDSPNKPTFPSTILKAGEVFKTSSLYKFSTSK